MKKSDADSSITKGKDFQIEHIKKPWGYEEIIEKNKFYVIKRIHVEPGHRLSLQYHKKKVETWIYNVNPPHMEHIPPGKIHRLVGPADIIEVSSPHLDDIIRLEDDYNRVPAKSSYEKK